MKSTFHANASQFAGRQTVKPQPSAGCKFSGPAASQSSSTGSEAVLGHPAIKISTTAGLGNIRITQWLAADLDCAELGRMEETLDSTGASIKTLTRIPIGLSTGEPDASYFTTPAGYAEVTPSVMNIAWGKHFGVEPTAAMIQSWQITADKKYYAAQNP